MSEDENQEPVEEDEQELSLDRLSEAYAEVLRQQAGESEEKPPGRGQLVAEKVAQEASGDAGSDDAFLDEEQSEKGKDDDAACPITPESIVESILFVGVPRGEKLTGKKIASVLRDVSPKEVRAIAKKLNEQYERENAAYRISFDSKSLSMVLAEDLSELQNEFFGRNREATLSQAAIDILAVVAYRQPIGRDEIEKARNKPVGGVLKQLVSRDLLSVNADEKNPRRKLYRTTDRFLDLFRLTELADLPQAHDVSELEEFE
jgi:segregation and condensation protein B